MNPCRSARASAPRGWPKRGSSQKVFRLQPFSQSGVFIQPIAANNTTSYITNPTSNSPYTTTATTTSITGLTASTGYQFAVRALYAVNATSYTAYSTSSIITTTTASSGSSGSSSGGGRDSSAQNTPTPTPTFFIGGQSVSAEKAISVNGGKDTTTARSIRIKMPTSTDAFYIALSTSSSFAGSVYKKIP